jgi:hypothetical protein
MSQQSGIGLLDRPLVVCVLILVVSVALWLLAGGLVALVLGTPWLKTTGVMYAVGLVGLVGWGVIC